jgi:hypothetical protein
LIFFKWHGESNLIFLKRVFFVNSVNTCPHRRDFERLFSIKFLCLSFKLLVFVSIKMLNVLFLHLLLTLFFGQSTDGKELTTAKKTAFPRLTKFYIFSNFFIMK